MAGSPRGGSAGCPGCRRVCRASTCRAVRRWAAQTSGVPSDEDSPIIPAPTNERKEFLSVPGDGPSTFREETQAPRVVSPGRCGLRSGSGLDDHDCRVDVRALLPERPGRQVDPHRGDRQEPLALPWPVRHDRHQSAAPPQLRHHVSDVADADPRSTLRRTTPPRAHRPGGSTVHARSLLRVPAPIATAGDSTPPNRDSVTAGLLLRMGPCSTCSGRRGYADSAELPVPDVISHLAIWRVRPAVNRSPVTGSPGASSLGEV